MTEEKNDQEIKETENNPEEAKEILNEDFFNTFNSSKKIIDKKKKINELITSLENNPKYLTNPNNKEKLSNLYNIILSNLIENNNNFVKSQIDLIEVLNKNLSEQNDFKKFYKQALPKLFDKFYLQNPGINENLTTMFNNSISKNTLSLKDYYPQIENISLEEDNDYRVNVLNFLHEQININKDITLDQMPKNIVDLLTKLSSDNDTQISDISFKLIETLNNRNNQTSNNSSKNIINVNSHLTQQENQLAFSSFIKKISNAVKKENSLMRNNNNNSNKNLNKNDLLLDNDEDINKNINNKDERISTIENMLINDVLNNNNNENITQKEKNDNLNEIINNNNNINDNQDINNENNDINNDKLIKVEKKETNKILQKAKIKENENNNENENDNENINNFYNDKAEVNNIIKNDDNKLDTPTSNSTSLNSLGEKIHPSNLITVNKNNNFQEETEEISHNKNNDKLKTKEEKNNNKENEDNKNKKEESTKSLKNGFKSRISRGRKLGDNIKPSKKDVKAPEIKSKVNYNNNNNANVENIEDNNNNNNKNEKKNENINEQSLDKEKKNNNPSKAKPIKVSIKKFPEVIILEPKKKTIIKILLLKKKI